ncbi:ATP synthase subunit b 1 [Desulfamplus magnetovallimortis]|uniref:ATP synthase subunit b n=1 Tax=Desulfamplus magnetovallimortis TaxID=1246637 RepID=A0A1W1H9D1_9BACT|nr:ATP synthase F0 subunit B [Desulfamplus magnetovallimortis]SLM28968.1 ATP synthase subunit b 1 [Desulfamplus magnetovallimortis]
MKVVERLKSALPAASILFFALVSAALASSGGGHEAAPKGWVITDTYKVLNFIVLAGALFYIARKPVAEFFTSRVKGIEEQLAELEQKKNAAQKALEDYEAKIADLAGESERMLQDYIKQGEDAKKRILAEAEAQAAKLEENAKRNIEQEFAAAKLKLQQEIVEKALAQAEAMVRESISSEDQDRLVDEYLGKVVAS